jgi:hypothetical protein
MTAKEMSEMTWLEKLRLLRSRANFVTANFEGIADRANPPVIDQGVTEFIRDRTKIYRDSWINPIIDELIEREERVVARRRKRSL